jgi:hypothetical protein
MPMGCVLAQRRAFRGLGTSFQCFLALLCACAADIAMQASLLLIFHDYFVEFQKIFFWNSYPHFLSKNIYGELNYPDII